VKDDEEQRAMVGGLIALGVSALIFYLLTNSSAVTRVSVLSTQRNDPGRSGSRLHHARGEAEA
jgi:hypothetical protein